MADWAFTVRKELATSKAIRTHKFGLNQFVIGKPAWEAYLKGDEKNPKRALAKAKALVLAEVKKQRGGARCPREPVFPPRVRRPGGG